jgi:glutathione S-transferase
MLGFVKDESAVKEKLALIPVFVSQVEKRLRDNRGEWLVGDSITWADLCIAAFVHVLCNASTFPEKGRKMLAPLEAYVDKER